MLVFSFLHKARRLSTYLRLLYRTTIPIAEPDQAEMEVDLKALALFFSQSGAVLIDAILGAHGTPLDQLG